MWEEVCLDGDYSHWNINWRLEWGQSGRLLRSPPQYGSDNELVIRLCKNLADFRLG